jgi:predicted GNAT family acetyltransferase
LNHAINPAARQYVGFINGEPVAFCAVLHQPNSRVKNLKRISRTVVRPDYQGIGIGFKLNSFVAEYYTRKGFKVTATTSSPALIHARERSPNWKLFRQGRVNAPKTGFDAIRHQQGKTSYNRLTTAWVYVLTDDGDMVESNDNK